MRNWRKARTALLSGLVCYLVLQVVLDGLVDRMWRPEYSHKLDGLRHALESADRPKTVVVLGSSRTAHGIKPSVMRPQLERELGQPVVVFNTGLPGNGPVLNLLTLRRFLADGVRPDLVLIEVLPAMLSGTDGMPGDLGHVQVPTISLRHDEISFLQHYAAPRRQIGFLEWALSRLAPSYYLRPRLLTATMPLLLPSKDRYEELPDDVYGWIPIISPLTTATKRPRALAQARREYFDRLKRFQLKGKSMEALEAMLELCEREHIKAALVVLPEGPVFRSWYPPGVLPQIQGYLAEVTQRYGATLIDAQRWLDTESAFLDSHHLLPAAAEEFSRRLGKEGLLPLLQY